MLRAGRRHDCERKRTERASEGSYNDESHGFARPFTTACGRASTNGEALIVCTRINKIRSPRQSFPLPRDSHATAMPTLGMTNYTGAATNKELTLLNQTVHSCHSGASVEKSPRRKNGTPLIRTGLFARGGSMPYTDVIQGRQSKNPLRKKRNLSYSTPTRLACGVSLQQKKRKARNFPFFILYSVIFLSVTRFSRSRLPYLRRSFPPRPRRRIRSRCQRRDQTLPLCVLQAIF